MSALTVSPKSARTVPILHLLASHPFVSYFILAFAGAWLFLAPMVLGQDGLGIFDYSVPFGLYVVLFLLATFTGPTLAAFVLTAVLDGRPGIRAFVRRFGQWRVGLRWYLIFLVGFPALYFVPASLYMGSEPWHALAQQWGTFFSVYLPGLLIFPAIINWGEEIGWRGFAQTRMQLHYGPLRTSLLVGFLHGIWHLPIFLLVQGPPAQGPFHLETFLTNIAMITVFTIVWTWIFNGARQSILIASLMHAGFNAAQQWAYTVMPDRPESVDMTITVGIVVLALLVVLLTKGRLGYNRAEHNR